MDDRGIVIFMVDEKMSPAIGKQLLKVPCIWLLCIKVIFLNTTASHRLRICKPLAERRPYLLLLQSHK